MSKHTLRTLLPTAPTTSPSTMLLAAALTAVLATAALGACSSAMRAEPVPVEPAVLETIRAQDSVGIVVVLVTPQSYYRGTSRQLQNDIANRQDRVLRALNDYRYRVRHRFRSVPAMTLVVYDEAAVHTLALLKRVSRIGLDDGSGGGGSS